MQKGVIYSARALHREVLNYQDQNKTWRTSRRLPFAYCEDSLSTIGLVTKEAVYSDGTAWGYEITPYGLTTGFDFAGMLLKWSYEHPKYSLYQMFASTNSSTIKDQQTQDKKRAQQTRLKIFWEIVTNPSNRIREADIVNATKETSVIMSRHLLNLNKNAVISYEATEHGKPISFYKTKETIPDKEPEQYRGEKILSTRVYEIIKKTNEYLSIEQVRDFLIHEYPNYKDRQQARLKSNIANVLTDLEKQGYVERKKFSSKFKSELTLSEEQREAILSLVTLIDKFQKGDTQTIREGRTFSQRVLDNPILFSQLMLKAKEASPYANRTDKETTLNNILSILQQYPNSTANQIREKLEEDYDKKLGDRATARYLFSLTQAGEIKKTWTKSGYAYIVAEPSIADPNIQKVII